MTYAYDTKQFEQDGHTFLASFYRDEDMGKPWKENDCHGPVRQGDAADKRPGERPLNRPDRHQWQYLYDWQGAMKLAARDGWGLAPDALAELAAKLGRTPTGGEVRATAVQRDYDLLAGWLADDWFWCGVGVQLIVDGEPVGGEYDHAVWGIESNAGDYLLEFARDCARDLLHTV